MSEPTEKDQTYYRARAQDKWKDSSAADGNTWCYASLDEVKRNLFSTAYPRGKLIFVKGKVEDTIPQTVPE